MKLIFSTLICPGYSGEEMQNLCDKFGMSGVELRTAGETEYSSYKNVKIVDIASSYCLFGYDGELLDKIKKDLKKIEKANIKGIRIFLGNFRRRHDAPARDIDYDGIVKMLQEMCDCSGCEIWVETHNEFATGKVLKKLIEDVGRDNIKIICDIMHPYEDGETPEKTMEYIGQYIAHVHIKDGKKREDPIWHDFLYTPLGEGELPIKKIVGLLEKNGYSGYYSLEWENAWRDELKSLGWSADEILEKYNEYMSGINTDKK